MYTLIKLLQMTSINWNVKKSCKFEQKYVKTTNSIHVKTKCAKEGTWIVFSEKDKSLVLLWYVTRRESLVFCDRKYYRFIQLLLW